MMVLQRLKFKWQQTERWLKRKLDIPEDRGWDMILDRLFDRLALMNQEPEAKADIAQRVQAGVTTGRLYWLEVLLSALVATFGLLQSSAAVIIGAMLIAPLLRPIQGMAYSIVVGRASLLAKSFRLLFMSVILSVLVPMLVLILLQNAETTTEITARTQPNLLDLLIAIFSAFIAILAFAYKRLSESVAGVAMATALMPPLVVIGMQLWWQNYDLAWGATLLFFTNLIAILTVGAVLFLFYGFNPHREKTESSLGKIVFLFLSVAALWWVLSYNLQQIQQQRLENQNFKATLQNILQEHRVRGRIENITIHAEQDATVVNGVLYVPSSVNLTRAKFNQIEQQIAKKLGKNIYLELDLLRTLNFEKEGS